MNLFTIKILAVVFMTIDHIGFFFFPEAWAWRAVGRLAFPIFAFTVANAFFHTGSRGKYLLRLLLLAVLCQVPFWLYEPSGFLNIFFTLGLGFALIWLYDAAAGGKIFSLAGLLLIAAAVLFAQWGKDGLGLVQYGGYGPALIFLFYQSLSRRRGRTLLWIGIPLITAAAAMAEFLLSGASLHWSLLTLAAALSLPFLLAYNGERGKSWKYFFYLYYPLHLFFLQGLALLLPYW